jgi:type IV pilus assembly protein PilB
LSKDKKIGEILIEKGLITDEQLKAALEEQLKTKEFLGAILLKRKQIKEDDLLAALSELFNIPFISIRNKYIDWGLLKGFSASLVLDYRCFPIQRNTKSVTIAINNPLDVWALKKAEEEARGLRLKLVLVSNDDMEEVIQRYKQHMKGDLSKLL